MNKKKVLFLSLIFVILTIISLYLVSAYEFPVNDLKTTAENVMRVIGDVFIPIFSVLLGVDQYDKYLFVRVLFLILMYFMILTVLKRIELFRRGRNRVVPVVIAAVISIIGARFIAETELIQGVMLPTGAMAIAMLVFLPFLIYGFFVHLSVQSGTARRMAWILFAAVFIGLWITRSGEIGPFGWIYGIGIAVVAIAVIFDGTIHEYFGISEARRLARQRTLQQIADIEVRLNQLNQIQNPSQAVRDSISDLEHRLRELYRRI